ncbi:MAG TPA: alpha/beta fold hydrolase, partial [Myxococcaceae bacterium]|nr:alpha/beta fold hydrolase [Myxococcaceae bacterium]
VRRYLGARGVRSSFASLDGYSVHYYALEGIGSGPSAVLVHGLGSSASGFFRLFGGLAKRFRRVLAVDLPGNGFSTYGSDGVPGRKRQVAVLVRFLEEIARQPAFLVGSSLGGAMSVIVSHRRPELVQALGLIAPAGARVPEPRLAELLTSLDCRTAAQARALTRRLFHHTPYAALLFAGLLRRMYSSEVVRAMLAEIQPSDCLEPEVLQGLRMPTLLIWGESEKLLPYESIDFFREYLPRTAEIRVVKGFGHVPQMERPGELVRHLIDFADRFGL